MADATEPLGTTSQRLAHYREIIAYVFGVTAAL